MKVLWGRGWVGGWVGGWFLTLRWAQRPEPVVFLRLAFSDQLTVGGWVGGWVGRRRVLFLLLLRRGGKGLDSAVSGIYIYIKSIGFAC